MSSSFGMNVFDANKHEKVVARAPHGQVVENTNGPKSASPQLVKNQQGSCSWASCRQAGKLACRQAGCGEQVAGKCCRRGGGGTVQGTL